MTSASLASLVAYKAYAELRAESSRYFLSMLWWVLDPIFSMMVYYVVFGVLLMRGGPDFVSFLLIGIVAWQWFERSALHGMVSIYNNGHLINLVRIPKLYFSSVTTAVDGVKFAIVFALLLVYLWSAGYPPTTKYLALLVLISVQLILIYGFALLLSGLMPLIPDMKYLVEVSLRLGFFASGVLFSVSRVPEAYRNLYQLNPMVNLLEAYRAILLDQRWPDWGAISAVAGIGLLLVLAGRLLIARFEYDYPRLLSR